MQNTMTVQQWRDRWQCPPEAYAELVEILTMPVKTTDPDEHDPRSEAYTSSMCDLLEGAVGIISWRNNVGAFKDEGRLVRYGLANESRNQNREFKSGDKIGILPYVVKPQDVGRTLGLFYSREDKKPSWSFTGDGREAAQLNWSNCVNYHNGVSLFVRSPFCLIDKLESLGLLSPQLIASLRHEYQQKTTKPKR